MEPIHILTQYLFKIHHSALMMEAVSTSETLVSINQKIAVFWVVAPCSLVEVYQRFRGPGDRPDDGGSNDL
jgi:hypothetical protein